MFGDFSFYTPFGQFNFYLDRLWEVNRNAAGALHRRLGITRAYFDGMAKYLTEFTDPYWIAHGAFLNTEQRKLMVTNPLQSFKDYWELIRFNAQVAEKGFASSFGAMQEFHLTKAEQAWEAWLNTLYGSQGEKLADFMTREGKLLEKVVYEYPKAIMEIKSEYGFHFDNGGFEKTAETDRFDLYQVFPDGGRDKVRKDGKPVVIVHPFVLGPNILCFLPNAKKSYVHAFANQGTPTYIRVMKDISKTPAVQTMTGEDDALDTKMFCEVLKKRHGRPVTLNGFCQGGFIAMAGLLSGELDGLVDALITCVAPMDGTRSKSLVEYLEHLPARFRDLGYAIKTLPNGNNVVDGKVMSWVYKLKSMDKEAPVFSFYRDLQMFDRNPGEEAKINKTAAALNHWLIYDRNDLPEAITRMSFKSYINPIDKNGTLPVKLFDRELNLKRLNEKGIKYLICYAQKDDLVDKETAIAPIDYVDAEVTEFPKGHGAIATSWSNPDTEYALHKRYDDGSRGPVRFHLDLEAQKTRKKRG